MTLMTLYRPLLSLSTAKGNAAKVRGLEVAFRAARRITNIFGDLYTKDLLFFLPDTAIAAVEAAAVMNLLYSTSHVVSIRDTSLQQFYLCWRVLLQLGDNYVLADTSIMMINAAAKKVKAKPALKTARPAHCSQSEDEMSLVDLHSSNLGFAVPFVDVVGDPKENDESYSWDQNKHIPDAIGMIDVKVLNHAFGDGGENADYSLDVDLFEQSAYWEALDDAVLGLEVVSSPSGSSEGS